MDSSLKQIPSLTPNIDEDAGIDPSSTQQTGAMAQLDITMTPTTPSLEVDRGSNPPRVVSIFDVTPARPMTMASLDPAIAALVQRLVQEQLATTVRANRPPPLIIPEPNTMEPTKVKPCYRKVREYPGKKYTWGADFQEHLLRVRKAMVTNAFGPDKQKIDYFLNTLDETTEPIAQSQINGLEPNFEEFINLASSVFIEGAATEEGEDFLPPAQRQLKSMRQDKMTIQAYSAKIQKVFNTAFIESEKIVQLGKLSKDEFERRMTEIERDAYAALTLQSNAKVQQAARKQ